MTHTPGPWIHEGGWAVAGPDKRPLATAACKFAADTIGDEVERSFAERSGREDAEATANARLIAAAPQLLAEVKAMHAEYCKDCAGGCPALALIAKAEGRAQ